MTTDFSRKLIGLRIYKEFCRMFPSGLGKVSPSEMNPFLMTMRLIKQEYGFSKPEVYSTLIALLQDYDPSLGVSHRDKTVRYIRLLLVDQPELANYLLYLLPESTRPGATEQQQQSTRCSQCSMQKDKSDEVPSNERLSERPNPNNGMLQRMVILPANDTPSEFSTSAVRIAPAVNTVMATPIMAASAISAANPVLTFGSSSKVCLPQLTRSSISQVKQLQLQSKPSNMNTLVYSPTVMIKSELLNADSSSAISLPRYNNTSTSSMVTTSGGASVKTVQDVASSLACHLGLKFATHITTLPKNNLERSQLPTVKTPILKATPKTVTKTSGSPSNRTPYGIILDDKSENLIKKAAKSPLQSFTGRLNNSQQQETEKSLISGRLSAKQSCFGSSDHKPQESFQQSTHQALANGLFRGVPTISPNQPMLIIEKTRKNIPVMTNRLDSSGIRIIRKCRGVPEAAEVRLDGGPATGSEHNPLISLRKLVAGVGLLKNGENETFLPSAVILDPEASVGIITTAKNHDKLDCINIDDADASIAKDDNETNAEVQEIIQEKDNGKSRDGTETDLDSVSKEVFAAGCSSELSDVRLSPFSNETSSSLLLNDGTSDYHGSDEELVLTTGHVLSTAEEKHASPDQGCQELTQRDEICVSNLEVQELDEEPSYKKMKITSLLDDPSCYEGCTYLARLMDTPSPPSYGHDDVWDLYADDKKRKAKVSIKKKRKKQV